MRKLLSLLLAGLMVLGLCSFAVAEEAPLVITVVCPFYGEAEPVGTTGEKTNPVLLAIEELCNVDLQIT